ncbi:hypothetical protein F5B22DRAFT_5248 [Xylaria bambusicola]|uniref:uncharacterized protein n=1 Tax=Xylaria bambusicola TaxID=326684 RepID=UPI00200794CB|nr:uncharacterized protein F5B22DRAFT_5248 [Xylaria bambusicola]KAI0527818.1 hypothetical protein F5B22DRAFT_5248 [Xylaria bambusicola]
MVQETTPATIDLDRVEKGGYTRLAEYMGQQPQLAIFRRFGTLANANLLYLQAEIVELENHLKLVQDEDSQTNDDARQKYFQSWNRLSYSACLKPGSPEREQYELIMKLRELMAQYHQALDDQKKTLALRTPHVKMLRDLREWIRRPEMGFIHITSKDWETWDYYDVADLVTFENSAMDRFTSLVTYTIIDVYHRLIGRHIHRAREGTVLPLNYQDDRHTVTYSHKSIVRFTQAFTVLIACTLPIAAIVVLYNVRDMPTRIGVIAALTGLFSTSMSILTMASLQEIFAATAA